MLVSASTQQLECFKDNWFYSSKMEESLKEGFPMDQYTEWYLAKLNLFLKAHVIVMILLIKLCAAIM